MKKDPMVRNITLIWLAWALIVIGFQALATARFQPAWPDRALDWTTHETGSEYQKNRAYLLEPFMNNQVAWDSEYYLGIAVGGYDDPAIPAVTRYGPTIPSVDPRIAKAKAAGSPIEYTSLAYAFFPFYPLLMHILAFPLSLLGLTPIATATLSGVLVSVLGALAGMLALYDLTKDSLGADGGLRAAFYLVIFPTGFFLAQVYTEGLFVGLAFSCLAMLKRRNWPLAGLLGIVATLTRAVGVALIIPMAITWFRTAGFYALDFDFSRIFEKEFPWRPLGRAILAFSPLIAFAIWRVSHLGSSFNFIETEHFQRGFLNLGMASYAWSDALRTTLSFQIPQHSAYYFTEFLGIVLGLVAIIRCLKTHPELAWFSLAVFLISWTSGPAQGMHRYILGAPAVFVTLAQWGKNPVFDRAWTIASLLLMGLLATLFAFNMWVA